MKWHENDEELLSFVKFLVDADIISTRQELSHFTKNIIRYTDAYNIYAKEIKGEIINEINDIRK